VNKTIPFFVLSICTFFLLSGCALMRPTAVFIQWPADINYMEAICELNMSWKDLQYSGEMSLALAYPETLSLEVYGPFGDTVFSIEKKNGNFRMKTGNEEITDEKRFHDIFKMNIEDFINDITMKGYKAENSNGTSYIQREHYRVIYHLNDTENKICWISSEGNICIRFLEVNFDRGQPVGKGSNKDL
jgi:hypothetical protein